MRKRSGKKHPGNKKKKNSLEKEIEKKLKTRGYFIESQFKDNIMDIPELKTGQIN